MMTAIFAALGDSTRNMLLTLLLFSLLIIWLQSRLQKDSVALRREIADSNKALHQEIADGTKALRQEITDGNKALRQEIADSNEALREEFAERHATLQESIQEVSVRLARVEGKLGLPAVRLERPAERKGRLSIRRSGRGGANQPRRRQRRIP